MTQAHAQESSPQQTLRWAVETYGSRLAVVTSFQPTGIITLHMLHEMGANPPILTLDTGLLFPESYAVMNELETRFNLNLIRVKPTLTVQQQADVYGEALWESNPDLCCQIRKVESLQKALGGYEAWVAGLRRDQSPTRTQTPLVSTDSHGRVKISPLVAWTDEMVWGYIHAHNLPYNALHDHGYPSIGCWPCTSAVEGSGHTRAGRWASQNQHQVKAKLECGIHL